MKRLYWVILLIILFSSQLLALDVPILKGRVNDYASIMSGEQRTALESKLELQEKETSNQVVVLTIPTLDGDDIEDFSIRVAEKWEIGQAEKDNGVILLVALNDKKMRIEVGKGLEGVLTDATSGRIIREVIGPAFKNGNYYQGIEEGTNKIFSAIKGEFTAESDEGLGKSIPPIIWIIILVIVVVVLLSFAAAGGSGFSGYSGGGYSGSSWSSGGGSSDSGSSGFSGGGGGFGGGGASGGW